MSCLYLTEADVDRLIDMPTAIDAMQRAFVSLAEGRAINVPRKRAKAGGVVLHSMSAAAELAIPQSLSDRPTSLSPRTTPLK